MSGRRWGWSDLSREGDPQTREDIEKRLAELDVEDKLDYVEPVEVSFTAEKKSGAEWAVKRADMAGEIRQTEAGKTIQATLDSLKARKEGEAPSAEHHLLNEVDSDTIAKVKELCGRDVSGYRHSVSAANIHHSMKKHPYLTDDDIMLLPDITSNYDKIRHEKKKEGDRLVYTKTYGDTTYEVAERIGRSNVRTSPKQLIFATEYITKHPADNRD